MKLNTRSLLVAGLLASCLIALSAPAFAGGPLANNATLGQPYKYPNGGQNIAWNPDLGGLGPMTNAQAVAQTDAAFAAWTAVASSTVSYVNDGSLPVDVTSANFNPWLNAVAPDGFSAIVYDQNGAIFNLLFGPGSGVLAFAGPEWVIPATGEILESLSFMNGGTIPGIISIAEFLSVQVHELGHYTNLAHTAVNGQIGAFGDHSGPSPNNTFPVPSLVNRIETMYPFIFIGGGMATPHIDDIAILSSLYPEPTFAATTGTIKGTVYAPNGITKLTGVNVIARNIANPFDDAVSALSSDFTDNFAQTNPVTGTFTLAGLTPGAQYSVHVDRIMGGGFSTPPLTVLPGPEEFHNTGESNNITTPDPANVFTAVASVAGVPTTGIDVIFNTPAAGDPLPLGDDTTLQLFLPFTYSFCGRDWDSVWVNSNGSISFGNGNTDFSESAAEMLSGPPRIAGVWDDLNAGAGGIVTFHQTNQTFTVSFQNVPQFPNTGAVSFDIILRGPPSQIEVSYGAISSTTGVAGVSCGGLFTTGGEVESDLSAAIVLEPTLSARNTPALYEVFSGTGGDNNDLDNLTVGYNTPNEFIDRFEDNDTFGTGDHVTLPFNSGARMGDSMNHVFTEVWPVGADVDWFSFDGVAGTTFLGQITRGGFDTMLGLFDGNGTLIAFDDDGGPGLLSRLIIPLSADGTYWFAVSAFPDSDFSGNGTSGGRYVASVELINGTVLALGDDTFVQVPLGFTFPYQGTDRTSVFVNSNGNLTFGAGNIDRSETIGEFLGQQPRIAALWDDLDPLAGGLVIAEQDAGSLKVSFRDVPEFLTTTANTFSITLSSTGSVTLAYGAVAALDGLVGVTQGGGAANPGETNFSAGGPFSVTGTRYELFTGTLDPLDLDNLTINFDPPGPLTGQGLVVPRFGRTSELQ